MAWYFRKKRRGDSNREPVFDEFFSGDSISDPGITLVREGIQNALDAGLDGEKVLVRIFLSGDEKAVEPDGHKRYFEKAWEHFESPDSGLSKNALPNINSRCPFIVFEDFGTTGLEGDPSEAFRTKTGDKNHFYHFFRAEGQSDKKDADRGSHGVGKHVFMLASRIQTVLGVTVRADDNQIMMMGRTVLSSHWVGNNNYQDGYYGEPEDQSEDFIMPITDQSEIKEFCDVFDIQRGNDSGLSLVIPWPDLEIKESAIIKSVINDYFYPILTGQLEVMVETPDVKTILQSETIINEVQKLGSDIANELQPLIELADWARSLPDEEKIILNKSDSSQACKWSDALISDEISERLREKYNNNQKIGVRVPVSIRKKEAPPEESYFDIYIDRDETERSGKQTFIREGIIIPDVKAPLVRGVRALIVIEDLPLAAFLRRAENPSHTVWNHVRLKKEYKIGYKTDLDFVKRSVYELLRIVTAAEKEEDTRLLLDFFSIPASPEDDTSHEAKKKKTKDKKGKDPTNGINPIPTKPKRFRIQKINGGFSIHPGRDKSNPPAKLEIQLGYFLRKGNPIKQYKTYDFKIQEPPIRFEPPPQNVEVLEALDNRLLIKIKNADFSFHATGFDENRDLYVKAKIQEDTDGY